MNRNVVLSARSLVKHYRPSGPVGRRRRLQAVNGVDLDLHTGATHALVGESGSGKTTVARLLLGLTRPDSGRVLLNGQDLLELRGRARRAAQPSIQLVFQDPLASLDPRFTARNAVAEPWVVQRQLGPDERTRRAARLLERVGIPSDRIDHYPHELSGGERQRVAIARSLAVEPNVLVLDEPVTALDVSLRAQVLDLLRELQAELGLAYLLIAHDLAVVDQIADTVSVMYLGRIVETGPRQNVLGSPRHPYTAALLSAVTIPDPAEQRTRQRIVLEGEPPSPTDPPSGCPFRTRCWKAEQHCAEKRPTLTAASGGEHSVACHHPMVA